MSLIDRQQIKTLTQLTPGHTYWAVTSNWILILIILALNAVYFHPLLWVPSWLLMARCQVACLGLMHEATHLRFHPSKKINDWIGQYLCASPVFFSLHVYRAMHFTHHKNPLAPEDPDLALTGGYPMASQKFLKKILKDFFGISALKLIIFMLGFKQNTKVYREKLLKQLEAEDANARYSDFNIIASGTFINLSLFFFCYFLGEPLVYLLFWVIPFLSITQVFLRIRGITEHAGYRADANQSLNTRTVINPLQTFFIAPYQLQYHIEHHLYPSVPFYNLRKVHQLLKQNDPAQLVHVYSSYKPVLRELLK